MSRPRIICIGHFLALVKILISPYFLSERVVVSHEAEVEPEPVASIEEEDLDNVAEVYDPCEKDEGVVVDAEPIQPPAQLSHSEVRSVPQGDAPKHSYASIVSLNCFIYVFLAMFKKLLGRN